MRDELSIERIVAKAEEARRLAGAAVAQRLHEANVAYSIAPSPTIKP